MSDKARPESVTTRSEAPPSSPRRLSSRPRPSEPTSRPRSRARILVVDDSAICLEATAMMLEDSGYEVVTIDSPFALSSALAREGPDLVLIDVTMPGLSGDKLVEIAVRNRGERTPVIVLHSDRSEHELRDLARGCGAAGFVRKTSDAEQLTREIDRFLRG